VANKEYIERLQMVITHLHKADSKHVATVPVTEVYQGKTIWQGDVEVFDLTGHPQAKRCYAWSHVAGTDDKDERFVAVLELPPITGAATAVKVAIADEVRKARR
jgi:hypothetical protein